MRKKLISILLIMALFGVVLVTPTQALSSDLFKRYIALKGGTQYNYKNENLGSEPYWNDRINNGLWTGENRPAPLMGDANIDGKVDAMDALFALNFSVYGNLQTVSIIDGSKKPPVDWMRSLSVHYNEGTLSKVATTQRHWLNYCRMNSPFFADVTKDCIVNALDALQILKYSVNTAKDFPEGDFTTIHGRFLYHPWATEYYPELYWDLCVEITDEEFCEKYHFEYEVSPTNS